MRKAVAMHTRRFLVDVARGWRLFQRARLRGADLRRARLDGLTLAGADLRRARLAGASMRGARLDGASLAHADMRGADLQGADLRDADMYGARLDGVNARGAWVTLDGLARLEDAPDAHYTGVIVSVHASGEPIELAPTGEHDTGERIGDTGE